MADNFSPTEWFREANRMAEEGHRIRFIDDELDDTGDEHATRVAISEATATIDADLRGHPIAGKKYAGLSKSGRSAWIAWTWLHRQLILRGMGVKDALDARNEAMERQHEIGTYAAIAEALS